VFKRSSYAGHLDVANIVDAKAPHRDTFEAILNTNREVARWSPPTWRMTRFP